MMSINEFVYYNLKGHLVSVNRHDIATYFRQSISDKHLIKERHYGI